MKEHKEKLGNAVWYTLHVYAYHLPADNYYDLACNLLKRYPCDACRDKAKDMITKALRQLRQLKDHANEDDIALWAFRFHNQISSTLHNNHKWIKMDEESAKEVLRATYCASSNQCLVGQKMLFL